MRLALMALCAAGTLAACDRDPAADTVANATENLTAEDIIVNDVTAIDAVTAQDANMAADVEFNADENASNAAGNNGSDD